MSSKSTTIHPKINEQNIVESFFLKMHFQSTKCTFTCKTFFLYIFFFVSTQFFRFFRYSYIFCFFCNFDRTSEFRPHLSILLIFFFRYTIHISKLILVENTSVSQTPFQNRAFNLFFTEI